MSKLAWDKTGERLFETGVDKGVLYPLKSGKHSKGVAWNGLIAVNESPSGAEITPLYADNIKYLNLMSAEEFGATIEAYTYPDEYQECLGEYELAPGVLFGQQKRSHFGMCYRTLVGNDQNGINHGYKLHLIYNCVASPTERGYNTVNDSPEAITFSWEISTTPVSIDESRTTATVVLDSTKFKKAGLFNVLKHIEKLLYGSDTTDAKLPSISEIQEAYSLQMYLRDSDNNLILDSSGNPIQSVCYD